MQKNNMAKKEYQRPEIILVRVDAECQILAASNGAPTSISLDDSNENEIGEGSMIMAPRQTELWDE